MPVVTALVNPPPRKRNPPDMVPPQGDEPDPGTVVQHEVREADVDGDAPFFLLLQAIGIGAGQGLDQKALAVIDVSGGADDDLTGGGHKERGVGAGYSRTRFTFFISSS